MAVDNQRIYIFTKYGYLGASSRYRVYQFLDQIIQAGLFPIIFPLFDDFYLKWKYSRKPLSIIYILKAFTRRLFNVLGVPRGSTVLVEGEIFPFFPPLLEYFLKVKSCILIIDYDDAMFHRYDDHSNWAVRRLFSRKIPTIIRLGDFVTVGNRYIGEYAARNGARSVKIFPTVVNVAVYSPRVKNSQPNFFKVGWIGTPSTAKYLKVVESALAYLCREGGVKLFLIGSGRVDLVGVDLVYINWSESTEVEAIGRLDVGIMPLPDLPWERGKCGLKLIQYMAAGLPVVASPVGVNCELVMHGVNGYLARSDMDWVSALQTLKSNRTLRLNMGARGRSIVEENYSLTSMGPRFASFLVSVVKGSACEVNDTSGCKRP